MNNFKAWEGRLFSAAINEKTVLLFLTHGQIIFDSRLLTLRGKKLGQKQKPVSKVYEWFCWLRKCRNPSRDLGDQLSPSIGRDGQRSWHSPSDQNGP